MSMGTIADFVTVQPKISQSARKAAAQGIQPQPATPQTPQVLRDKIEARLSRLRLRTNNVADEETVEAIADLKEQESYVLDETERENKIRVSSREGTLDRQTAERQIAEYTTLKSEIQAQLRGYRENPEYAQAYQQATELCNLRFSAQRAASSIADIRSGEFSKQTVNEITGCVDSALASHFIVKTAEGEAPTWTWKGQGYRSAKPNDPAVSSPSYEIGEFIAGFQAQRQSADEERKVRTTRDGLLISYHREKAVIDGLSQELPSELDRLREDPTVVRTLTAFCAGKGEMVLVHMPDRQGEVLLRRTGPETAVMSRATNARTADTLFYYDDREGRGRILRNRLAPINLKDPSFSEVRPPWFGEILVGQLRQEAQSQANWKTAEGLRDTSKVEDLITALGLVHLKEVGTCVINAKPTLMIGGKGREVELTLHIAGLPDDQFQVVRYVEGTAERIDPDKTWLQPAIENPQSRRLLREVPEWREVVKANSWSDRDWQVARETTRFNAVAITKANQKEFFDLKNLKDGKYVLRASSKSYNDHFPVGLIVELSGSTTEDPKVELIWAVPSGKSAELYKKFNGQKLDRANLPNDLRFVFGNVYWMLNRTRENPKVEMPSDLQPVKQTK
jgi:hypothetical protein